MMNFSRSSSSEKAFTPSLCQKSWSSGSLSWGLYFFVKFIRKPLASSDRVQWTQSKNNNRYAKFLLKPFFMKKPFAYRRRKQFRNLPRFQRDSPFKISRANTVGRNEAPHAKCFQRFSQSRNYRLTYTRENTTITAVYI